MPRHFKKAKNQETIRASYIAKTAPSTHEIGWLGHKKFKGTKDKVQIKFDPNDEKIKDQYIYHTHPADNPTPLHALPSEQDLITAQEVAQHGLSGIVIFSHPYYTVITPTIKTKPKPNFHNYLKSLKNNDIEDALKQLERLGYDIETGQL